MVRTIAWQIFSSRHAVILIHSPTIPVEEHDNSVSMPVVTFTLGGLSNFDSWMQLAPAITIISLSPLGSCTIIDYQEALGFNIATLKALVMQLASRHASAHCFTAPMVCIPPIHMPQTDIKAIISSSNFSPSPKLNPIHRPD